MSPVSFAAAVGGRCKECWKVNKKQLSVQSGRTIGHISKECAVELMNDDKS